jgi:hypothetical protein
VTAVRGGVAGAALVRSPADEWVYWKIYVGHTPGALDFLVREVVPRASELDGVAGSFFLRYLDDIGPHLRLRLRAVPGRDRDVDVASRAICDDGLRDLRRPPDGSYRPMLRGLAVAPNGPDRPPALVRGRYEPEVDKFGGPLGMPIAEGVFQASSDLAVAALRAEAEGQLDRKHLVPGLLAAAFDAFVGQPSAASAFWRRYGLYWLGGDSPAAARWQALFSAKAEALQASGVRVRDLASSPVERRLATTWRGVLDGAVAGYTAVAGAVPGPDHLAFQFAHLMSNRLGIVPMEEAYLASLLAHEAVGR